MSAYVVNEETIPAAPGDILVTIYDRSISITANSPWIIQHTVAGAGVRDTN